VSKLADGIPRSWPTFGGESTPNDGRVSRGEQSES
jgi:hypothetical protein